MASVGSAETADDDEVLGIEFFKVFTTAGTLCCEACGEPGAPLVICLHGHHPTSRASDWRAHLPILAEQGLRVVALTFPGCGEGADRSEGMVLPDRPDTVLMPGGAVAAVMDLIAQLTQQQPGADASLPPLALDAVASSPAKPREAPPPRVALIGEGWGASVALACAQWEPAVISSLVLYHVFVDHGRSAVASNKW